MGAPQAVRPRPLTVLAMARRAVVALERDFPVLYPLIAEQEALATSSEREPGDPGQPRGVGGVSDPTGNEVMRLACKLCDGNTKVRHIVECLTCRGRCHIIDPTSGDAIPCGPCDGKGKTRIYGPEDCDQCDDGWQFTPAQALGRACDRAWLAVNMVIRAVEGLAEQAPEFAKGASQVDSDIAEGKRARVGERFEAQRKGFTCEACGTIVPRLKHQLCVAYATDPASKDLETGRYVPSPEAIANNCYGRWSSAYAAEGISRKDWIRREKDKRAGTVRNAAKATEIVEATKR